MMQDTTIISRLIAIENQLQDLAILKKDVLSLREACIYLEISPSHLYKLTSEMVIPFYKPNGKKLYFKLDDLNNWLLKNRVESREEINQKALEYVNKNNFGKGGRK